MCDIKDVSDDGKRLGSRWIWEVSRIGKFVSASSSK
jgi:hypothetical protein